MISVIGHRIVASSSFSRDAGVVLLLFLPAAMVAFLAPCVHASSKEHILKVYMRGSTTTVAGPGSVTNNASQVGFGSVLVFDTPFTEGPDETSKYLGQARGIAVVDNAQGNNVLNLYTLDFSNDQFSGSLTFSGTESLLQDRRIVPIIGGSGDFLLSKGYLVSTPVIPTGDPTNGGTLYALYLVEIHYVTLATLGDF